MVKFSRIIAVASKGGCGAYTHALGRMFYLGSHYN